MEMCILTGIYVRTKIVEMIAVEYMHIGKTGLMRCLQLHLCDLHVC